MDEPDNIVVEMSIASAQEDEQIKAIEFDRMTDQASKSGFDTNIQYVETAPHNQPPPPFYIPPQCDHTKQRADWLRRDLVAFMKTMVKILFYF